MKRIKGPTFDDWIANVCDAEDMAIRKREGLPLTSTGYAYHGVEQPLNLRPKSDYEQGRAARRYPPNARAKHR